MTMIAPMVRFGELWHQAGVARGLGSSFVGAVLEAGQRQLFRAPRTEALFETWAGDPSDAALAMRFNAALHALARGGSLPQLSALYQRRHDDFDGAIGEALAARDEEIVAWMQDTPQTNEVGRPAAMAAALMVIHGRFGMPVELLEIGSSCGLNLNLAHYGYDLGGERAGVLGSPVQITPIWTGLPPIVRPFSILSARGTDLNPLDAADPATRERLLAYIWADQPQRARRLEQAFALAMRHPPRIDREDAVPWLARRLDAPQDAGTCRLVVHSMVLQYMTAADRERVDATIATAGARATATRPLARIGLEWAPGRAEVQLRLTCWPGGHSVLLATCHPYGNWIDWRAPNDRTVA